MATNQSGFASVTVSTEQAQQLRSITIGQSPAAAPFKATSASVGDASRLVVNGGQGGDALTTRGTEFARHTVNAETGSQPDLMSTVRTPAGAHVSAGDIKPHYTVDVGGMRTSVRAALASGLVTQDADGTLRARGEAPVRAVQPSAVEQKQQDQQQAHEEQPEKVADLEPQAHGYVEEFASKVDNITATSIMEGITRNGNVSEHDLAQAASLMGVEASELRQRIDIVRAGYEAQARELVGPHADDIFAWAYKNEPALMREAIKAHVENEDPRAYDAVRYQYFADLSRSNPDALLNATNARELGVRRESSGTITIDIPKVGRMPFAAAVRAGLIVGKPSSKRR